MTRPPIYRANARRTGLAGSLRFKRRRAETLASRHAFRTVMGLAAAVCLPVLAALVLMSRNAGPDLFDLVPKSRLTDGYVLLAWPELERPKRALHTGGISSGTLVRSLGYMMEGNRPVRDGESVESFVLLPDAGGPIPAHRFGDQMISVRPETGRKVRFAARTLVWAWGRLRVLPGNPDGDEPLYVLEHAGVEPANKADIPRYFK